MLKLNKTYYIYSNKDSDGIGGFEKFTPIRVEDNNYVMKELYSSTEHYTIGIKYFESLIVEEKMWKHYKEQYDTSLKITKQILKNISNRKKIS